jgi:putative membrane-bound dehydrogenase-like protein
MQAQCLFVNGAPAMLMLNRSERATSLQQSAMPFCMRLFRVIQFMAIGILCSKLATADERPALPRSQPVEPAKATSTFALKDGFTMQLVAAEPLVTDPVAGAFDEDGRLYVVEMNDYPYTDKSTDKPNVERTGDLPIGKVRLLEDTDNDGVFDKSLIFARDFSWPTGIAVYRGGIFVAATPDVWYLKDEDGDGQADTRTKIFSGFRKLNVQAVANNLIWGLDHKVYGAGGTNGGKIINGINESVPAVTISRNDFCFDPINPAFELLSGGARFGNTFDDWGNRFICNIRNPIQHIVLPQQAVVRNSALNVGSPMNDVAVAGDQIPVFRSSPPEPWRVVNAARLSNQGDPRMPRSEKNAQGFMTSACGVTIYRGDAYPPEFRQQVFLAEVAGNLIHRQHMSATGVTFTSQRIDDKSEFMTSTDNWFRPVNFLHAPDGTLYVLDMYRETIEHPWSMPDDLKALLDLENGRDRGRIYRLTPPSFERRGSPKLSSASTAELVALLQHPNAWHRETAHRLLFERQDAAAVPLLKAMFNEKTTPLGKVHALWSLQGMSQLDESLLIAALHDPAAEIREQAVILAARKSTTPETPNGAIHTDAVYTNLLQLAADESPRVRYQVALALGDHSDAASVAALMSIARRDAADPWMVIAALSSSSELATRLLDQVLQEPDFLSNAQNLPLLKQMASVTGVQKNPEQLKLIGERLQNLPGEIRSAAVIEELLLALEDGLRRGGSRLSAIWSQTPAEALLTERIQQASGSVKDPAKPVNERLAALKVVSLGDASTIRQATADLLTTSQPVEIQTAVVKALSADQDESTASTLLAAFSGTTPAVQYEIIEALAGHNQRLPILFDAIADGRISAAQMTPLRRTLLLNHADEKLRERAKSLLALDRQTPRQDIINANVDATKLPGDLLKGKALFVRECSACHRIGETGIEVGPSLITVRHRTASELLTQILDPNREVGPNYMQFAVALHDGQVLAGMIAEESPVSLTLKQAENKQQTLQREQIAEIKATGLSLMPEGFEKKLSPQDFADLIAFLRGG